MEISATMTSKGQLTIPKQIRDALGISEGDRVLLRVEGDHAVLARTPELLDLAGAVSVPVAKRGTAWDDVRRATRRGLAERVVRGSRANER